MRNIIQKCLTRIIKTNSSLLGAIADTFMLVKSDYILPNHILIIDYLSRQKEKGKCKCGGKQQCQECIFKNIEVEADQKDLNNEDILSDLESIKPDKRDRITLDEGPIMKIIERRVYEENKHIFPYYNWKAFEISKRP